jgi:iron(III) transport system substrate-binding protein
VLLINSAKLPNADSRPTSVLELADTRWRHRCGMAYPVYGTTATHLATLRWIAPRQDGKLDWDSWADEVAANSVVLAGNKQVAVAVGRGELDWG